MFAYQHLLIIFTIWLIVVFVVYLSTGKFPNSNYVILAALLLSGFFIDIDHFRPQNYIKGPECALQTSNDGLVKNCPFIVARGILHHKEVGLFLIFIFVGWVAHIALDEMWLEWWWW